MKILKRKVQSLIYLIRLRWFNISKYVYKIAEERGYSKGRIRIGHVTYYAGGNAGDIALSQCIRRTYEKLCQNINWNIINVRAKVDARTIDDINSTKLLVLGGGGLFLPDSNENGISGWQWAISKQLLNKIEVPIIVYSVGYNYFRGQECNDLFIENVTALCEKASFVGLRNSGSVHAIKEILPEKIRNKVKYQPCTTTIIRKVYGDKIPPKKISRKIAFNIAFDREQLRYGDKQDEILTEIAKAAKMIEQKGYIIVVVYHVWSDRKIKEYMDRQNVHYKEMDLNNTFPKKIYNFYNEVDLTFGMRGHSQMIPFGLNGEIISLSTHDKMKWFLEDIDAVDWCIDLVEECENLSEKIYNKFIEVHELNHDNTQKRLLDAQEKLWQITRKNMDEICGYIE